MRDHHREHNFLTAAAGGHPAFVKHATARLELGQPIYGDSWQWIGMRRHLRELAEEAADLGAWATLADQALDITTDVPNTERIRAVLRSVARSGGQAHALLTPMLRALDAAHGGTPTRRERSETYGRGSVEKGDRVLGVPDGV